MAVAATCFRAKLAGQPTPAGERTVAGYRRTASDRGRGQARPFGVSNLAAVLATCHRPRRRGRGIEVRPPARPARNAGSRPTNTGPWTAGLRFDAGTPRTNGGGYGLRRLQFAGG